MLLESKSIIDESDLIDSLQLLVAVVPIGHWASLDSDDGFLLAKNILNIIILFYYTIIKNTENINQATYQKYLIRYELY